MCCSFILDLIYYCVESTYRALGHHSGHKQSVKTREKHKELPKQKYYAIDKKAKAF